MTPILEARHLSRSFGHVRALDGADFDVQPGEMVTVGPEGVTRERYAPKRDHAHCVFEHVYFSRPDSIVFGRPVQESRENLGRLLAREHPVDADVVVPVRRSTRYR